MLLPCLLQSSLAAEHEVSVRQVLFGHHRTHTSIAGTVNHLYHGLRTILGYLPLQQHVTYPGAKSRKEEDKTFAATQKTQHVQTATGVLSLRNGDLVFSGNCRHLQALRKKAANPR